MIPLQPARGTGPANEQAGCYLTGPPASKQVIPEPPAAPARGHPDGRGSGGSSNLGPFRRVRPNRGVGNNGTTNHHIEVAKALYSIPGHLIGQRVKARADTQLVKAFFRGTLVKVHPRKPPGGRSTDPADMPAHKTAYAMRDLNQLKRIASGHGKGVGDYAGRLPDIDLPWTKMRQVYRLLGLVRRFGPERVDVCCRKALELDVVDVSLIGRMLERASDEAAGSGAAPAAASPVNARVIPMRFARSAEEFRPGAPTGGTLGGGTR
ncbi:MAG: Mu transposase domain-containing protein [Actinomycetota bacterium]